VKRKERKRKERKKGGKVFVSGSLLLSFGGKLHSAAGEFYQICSFLCHNWIENILNWNPSFAG